MHPLRSEGANVSSIRYYSIKKTTFVYHDKGCFLCFQTKIQVNQAKIKQIRLRSGRSAVTDGMGGAILFSMIAGIGCIVYAADNRS